MVRVKPELRSHKERGPRFLPVLHASYTVDCLTALVGEEQDVMCSEKVRNSPRLCPVKGQKPRLGNQTRSQN